MATILGELKRRRLCFLDSRTSTKSIAFDVAKELHLPSTKRDVFIDNLETESHIREKIKETAFIAAEQGFAVAIGHYKSTTLSVLAEEIPKLERQGFEIVSLPQIIPHPQPSQETARTS